MHYIEWKHGHYPTYPRIWIWYEWTGNQKEIERKRRNKRGSTKVHKALVYDGSARNAWYKEKMEKREIHEQYDWRGCVEICVNHIVVICVLVGSWMPCNQSIGMKMI